MDEQIPAEQVIEQLRAENARLRDERDTLQHKLEALLRQVYGRRTERVTEDGYGPLFAQLEEPEPPPPPHAVEAPDDEDPVEESTRSRKPRRRGAPRLPEDIRRVVEEVEPTDEQARCSSCDEPRQIIGYEETEKLEYEPARCFLRVIRRPKLACKHHEEAGVVTPDLPPQVIHKGLAGASMLAQVVTAKYRDHLPLYRHFRRAVNRIRV